MSIKMSDIANLAQVSKSAVSLAINGKEGISQETRTKILNVIKQYGYSPLRRSHKQTITNIEEVTFLAVTMSGLVQNNYRTLPFFNSLIASLSENVAQLGGNLSTMTVNVDSLNNRLDKIKNSNKASGTLVLGTDLTKDNVLQIKSRLKNVVFLDTNFNDIAADCVTMDNYQGARLAAEYIIEKGYKRIGYFASDKSISNFNARRRGFYAALTDHDLQIRNEDFYFTSPIESDIHEFNIHSLGNGSLPQAIFCEDDYIAIRLIKSALESGLRVPEDITVMGFDDIYEGTLITPELTTIHVSVDQLAKQALYQLQEQISSKEWRPQKTLVSTNLVKRTSL
ncbi:LacI family DNA-binding transcriptional regulator [Oenococcus oeni]